MKLLYADQAVVPEAKLTEYLLNPSHPEGRSKAACFLGLGFLREEPDVLRQALLRLAPSTEMDETIFTFGRKYAGAGLLDTPGGNQVSVLRRLCTITWTSVCCLATAQLSELFSLLCIGA